MAKQSGLGWTTCSVDDSSNAQQAIINDVTSLDFASPRGKQDVTGIDKSAYERLLLLADFTIALKGVFNTAAGKSHAVFKTVPSTSVNRLVSLTVSAQNFNNHVIFTDYKLARKESGEFTWDAPGELADGNVPTWS